MSHHAQKIESKAVESQIRKIEDNERPSFKRGMELEWVQLCPHCDMWVGRLVEHMKSAHPDLDYHMIKTKCPFEPCDRSVVDIENHIRLVHDKVRNFSCEKCDAKFTSSHHLLKHTEAAHTNIRVECNLCGKVFKSTTIENHIKRVHHGLKPSIPCSNEGCGKTFGSKADMERHVLAVHMKFKASCPECGKQMRMEFLTGHIKKAHHGIHSIKCPECGKGFQNKKTLAAHVRARHIGFFFYCKAIKKGKECGKILVSEKSLLKHVVAKHSSPKVTCSDCGEEVLECFLSEHEKSHLVKDTCLPRCPLKTCRVTRSDCSAIQDHVSYVHVFAHLNWCQQCQQFNIDAKIRNIFQ